MNALVDTNILVRLQDTDHPISIICRGALRGAVRRGDVLYLCAQSTIEFWSVATRPRNVNGLGLTSEEAEAGLKDAEQWMFWLPEPPDVGKRWRNLVNHYNVLGKQAHDVRLVALSL